MNQSANSSGCCKNKKKLSPHRRRCRCHEPDARGRSTCRQFSALLDDDDDDDANDDDNDDNDDNGDNGDNDDDDNDDGDDDDDGDGTSARKTLHSGGLSSANSYRGSPRAGEGL